MKNGASRSESPRALSSLVSSVRLVGYIMAWVYGLATKSGVRLLMHAFSLFQLNTFAFICAILPAANFPSPFLPPPPPIRTHVLKHTLSSYNICCCFGSSASQANQQHPLPIRFCIDTHTKPVLKIKLTQAHSHILKF